ncbi:MAG: hypothetical protein NT120_01650 [Candidatus Aenigmarchaeota archaeon]|nr:hypothetical protein [Candidatus Aenigmarchaeota archaeon]
MPDPNVSANEVLEPTLIKRDVFPLQGSFQFAREYYSGWTHINHGNQGIYINGLTGPETMVEKTVVIPIDVYEVGETRLSLFRKRILQWLDTYNPW